MVKSMKEKLLISACLLGHNVKYNGRNNKIDNLQELEKYFEFIPVCPEVMGGLPIPRIPSERVNNKVINKDGIDVTINYEIGKSKVLELVKNYNIKYALLKEKSPSCGKTTYDGTFTHKLINKPGITYEALFKININIFSEHEIELLIKEYKNRGY